MPQTSILIRTYNEQEHLPRLFQAIASQKYQDYEIVLVDSGSTDRTLEIAKDHCDQIIPIHSRDFTFGYSLNVGCAASTGEYIVIVSAHAIPFDNRWLGELISALQEPSVAMVYGRHIGVSSSKFSEVQDFKKSFPPHKSAYRPYPYYALNANAALKQSLWRRRPFQEHLTGLEDIAWAKAAMEDGHEIRYVPTATVEHIHNEHWNQVYNRYRREAMAAKLIGLPHPPHGHPHLRSMVRDVWRDVIACIHAGRTQILGEIFRFRYNQWRGTREGWRHGVDLQQERFSLFYSNANRAVVIEGAQRASLKDVPMPEVKPGDVLLKILYTGICRTDLEVYDGTLGYYRDGRAHYPIVPGHEYVGEIVQKGANVSTLNIGDRVVGECILGCQQCQWCRSGSPASCPHRKEVGVMNHPGAYASFLSIPSEHAHRVPPTLSASQACLAEPLAVVLRALRRSQFRIGPGSRCAVVGAGPIGNLAAQVLERQGHEVTVFARSTQRLDRLKPSIGRSVDLEGLGRYDVIIEATGNQEALASVLRSSRTDATIVLLGFPYGSMEYNFEDVVGSEKVIIGSVGGAPEDFRVALEMLPLLDTVALVETVIPIEDFARAWELHREGAHLKILLKVGKEATE